MVETIVYGIWAAGRFDEIIHYRKLSFEKVLTRVNLACINLPVVNIHLESDRDAERAPPFRSAYRTRRSLLFLRFFNDSLTREAGGATRPTPLAHCRPAHSPDVALNLFIRKANGLCSTPLACHLATLLRAIRSTDKERRSIERRSLSVLLIALRRVARWHAKGVEQRPFAFRINKLRATSGEWAGRQCAKGVGRVAPPASRVSESLKKRRKRRLLRVRYAERKGGARSASRSLSRWMLTTGKFIQAKLTRVNTFSKESFL